MEVFLKACISAATFGVIFNLKHVKSRYSSGLDLADGGLKSTLVMSASAGHASNDAKSCIFLREIPLSRVEHLQRSAMSASLQTIMRDLRMSP